MSEVEDPGAEKPRNRFDPFRRVDAWRSATQLGKSFADGVDLSTGQWQKLALGRALMREVPLLLVLDGPTASLDAETEHALFERYAGAARRARRPTEPSPCWYPIVSPPFAWPT